MKTACLLGATGLVGSELLKQLLVHPDYDTIKLFVRKNVAITHPKITQHIIQFDEPDTWKSLVSGDVLFSAFGTTIRKAGSKEAQYKVDYTYQYEFAKAAAENGIKRYVLVSSVGANANSSIFYNRIKGELDDSVRTLSFEHISIIRPSILEGKREETRIGEQLGIFVAKVVRFIPFLKPYQPISAFDVAKAMLAAENQNNKTCTVWELDKVKQLADSYSFTPNTNTSST